MAVTTLHHQPGWWTREYDIAWNRVRAVFKRDWERTKHDSVYHVPRFEEHEPALRFGYGAYRRYHTTYPEWNEEVEELLREDWGDDWNHHRDAIYRGWAYQG
jgi:hypothetical protein